MNDPTELKLNSFLFIG